MQGYRDKGCKETRMQGCRDMRIQGHGDTRMWGQSMCGCGDAMVMGIEDLRQRLSESVAAPVDFHIHKS